MAIEIVSFPLKNGDFPEFFVSLPEGKCAMAFIASNYGMVHGISKAWAPEMKNAKLETLGYFRNMWFWTWKWSTWVREWVIHILAVSSGAGASWMDPEPRFQHENLLGSGLSDHGPLWYGHDPHAGLCSMAVTSDGSSESNGAGLMTNKVMGCIPMYNLSLLNRFSFWKTQTQWIFSFPKRCNVPIAVVPIAVLGMKIPEDMPENGFLHFMEWTTRLFWTFDSRWQQKTGERFFLGYNRRIPRIVTGKKDLVTKTHSWELI